MHDVLTLCEAEPMIQNEEFQLQLTCWDNQYHEGCKAQIIVKKQHIKHRITCDDRDYYVFKCPCCGLEHTIPECLIPRKIRRELIGPDYFGMFMACVLGLMCIGCLGSLIYIVVQEVLKLLG